MYAESVWWPRAAGGIVAVLGMAKRLSTVRRVILLSGSMQRLETRLDGLVLLAPARARRRARASSWRPSAPTRGPRTASRRTSCRTTTRARAAARCAASTSRPHPGQGKLVRVRPRARARRRRRPAARLADLRRVGGASCSTTIARHQLWIPVGFGHGFCVLSRDRRLRLQVHELLRPGDRGGLPLRRPGRRHRVAATSSCCISERDRDAPRLAEIADDAAVLRRERRRPLRAEPDRHRCTSATCARRCSRGCSRARPGARFLVRMEDLDTGRVRPGSAERAARRPARRSGSTGTARSSPSRRGSTLYADGDRALRAAGLVYECFCTRAEIRAAASAPHGPLPEGAYPGTCLQLTDAERARAARGGPRRRRCGCAPAPPRVASTDRAARPASRASSTTSSCAATTARPPTTSRSWSTTRAQGIGEVVRGDDLADSTPRQLLARPPARPARAALRARAARARPRRRAAGQAPRRRDAARARSGAAALEWMIASLDLPPASDPDHPRRRVRPGPDPARADRSGRRR